MAAERQKFADLSFSNQCAVVLIELLYRVIHKKETMARVEDTLIKLFDNVPWSLHDAEVVAEADMVAHYGIEILPAYIPPADESEEPEEDNG